MRRLLFFGILLTGAGAVGALFTFPQYQKFQAQSAVVAERELEVQNRERYFADLRELEGKLKEFPGELKKIEAAIPQDPELPALYEFLQATAAGSGLVLRDISSSGAEKQDGALKSVPVALQLTGSYEAFKEFLLFLGSASRLVNVRAVEVSGSQEPAIFTFNLELNAYSY